MLPIEPKRRHAAPGLKNFVMTTLKGITWNHTRGFTPLVAGAQRFAETHPGVEIAWHKRSLQEFADYPIQKLAETFDLLVVDHPFSGYAAAHPTLLPLDEHLPSDYLEDQAQNSVGVSHASYEHSGHQWALAIDAAAPVAAWREDLLEKHDARVPQSWDELLALARRGLVAVPAIPIDSLMNWFMLCVACGEEPFAAPNEIVSAAVGGAALGHLRELVLACGEENLSRNPIATYEEMASGASIAYCPFAYGYANYARRGYAPHALRFGGLVAFDGQPLRSTLGGTGLAISARSENREAALEYAQWIASPQCQRSLYVESGGQPGHRAAWTDESANRLTGDFFRDTLSTLDAAYLRPRYDGYLPFQDEAGPVVHRYYAHGDARACLDELNALYRGSGRHE